MAIAAQSWHNDADGAAGRSISSSGTACPDGSNGVPCGALAWSSEGRDSECDPWARSEAHPCRRCMPSPRHHVSARRADGGGRCRGRRWILRGSHASGGRACQECAARGAPVPARRSMGDDSGEGTSRSGPRHRRRSRSLGCRCGFFAAAHHRVSRLAEARVGIGSSVSAGRRTDLLVNLCEQAPSLRGCSPPPP